jgi:predicted MFS family arabinose efflux permease
LTTSHRTRPAWSYLIPSRPPPLEPKHWSVLGLVLLAEISAQYCTSLLILALPQVQTALAIPEERIGSIGGIVRLGMIATLAITTFADRLGRRRVLLLVTGLQCGLTAASGLVASYEQYLVLQTAVRLCAGAVFMLGAVVITEEFVAEHRGFGLGALAALGSLGYAAAIGLYAPLDALPAEWLRDGWRGLHLVGALPLLGLPLLGRRLQETTRFATQGGGRAPFGVLMRTHRGRLLGLGLLAGSAEIALWPAFTLVSKHLRDVHGYGSADVSAVIFAGGLVGIAGNLVAGQLGDRFGRRPVAAAMFALSALATWCLYGSGGIAVPVAWAGFVFALTGSNVLMTALSGELFPTAARSTAAGFRMSLASVGGALGFYLESQLYRGSHGDAILALLPALGLAALSLWWLPESAGRELEDLESPHRQSAG